MRFKGKVACITGSARGLGLAIAEEMAKEGATVVLNDLDEASVQGAVSALKDKGYAAYGFVANVAIKNQAVNLIESTVQTCGKIDILVNNAGGELRTPKKLEEISEEAWDLVLDVNLKGTFMCSQAAVTHMKEQGFGRIINLSSIGGRTASIVTGVAYAAAKGGIIAFTRRLAKEVGQYNIRVNAVAPGLVISGERLAETWNKMNAAEQASVLEDIPLQSLGSVEDQAKVVAFLASDDSNYITGAVLDVNGGRFMG